LNGKTLFDRDPLSAIEAVNTAQWLAFAPLAFQAAASLRDRGLLDVLAKASPGAGCSIDDVMMATGMSRYAVRVLLEAGFDELKGVSWTKGCYMGQELTARTRYRGLVKRRLVPVALDGPPPPRGTPVTDEAGAELGEMRSCRDGLGLALLRIEALDRAPLRAAGTVLTPRIPAWMRLPAREQA